MRRAGATLHRGARASHYRGLSCCGAQAPDAQAQQLWLSGPAAPRHVGCSQTRALTCVPCIGRQILNHCATREALFYAFDQYFTSILFITQISFNFYTNLHYFLIPKTIVNSLLNWFSHSFSSDFQKKQPDDDSAPSTSNSQSDLFSEETTSDNSNTSITTPTLSPSQQPLPTELNVTSPSKEECKSQIL